jgi:hypothetical protein
MTEDCALDSASASLVRGTGMVLGGSLPGYPSFYVPLGTVLCE